MGAKVKALIWEECRVGGAIAGVTLAAGLLALLSSRLGVGPFAARDSFFLSAMGAPLSVALLLILNPDHSGALGGGYSRRILRLPVSTSVAVAISLCARTTFVSLVTLVSIAVAAGLFDSPIGFETVLLVAALYMGAQLLDWLRAPISGLSSVVVLVLAAAMVFLPFLDSVGLGDVIAALLADGSLPLAANLALFAGGLAVTYAIAVPAVHAARVGRSIGVPEIWEWPKRVSIGGKGRAKPFSSPLAAQVWLELRRSAWILPGVALLVCLIGIGGTWIYQISRGGEIRFEVRALFSSIPFVAVILGAIAYGGRGTTVGFRWAAGTPGYTYLQPLTHAQFALSRVISNGIVLLPMVILALVAHFSMAGGTFLFDVLPQALDQEFTSMREVVWILLSRGVLTGLLAWIFMAISTRLVIVVIAAGSAVAILGAVIADGPLSSSPGLAIVAVSIFFIGSTVGAYAHAWRSKLVSPRMIAVWACVWALVTWLVYGASRDSIHTLSTNLVGVAAGFVMCLALTALVPLPYIAVAIDVRRRRHSASPAQDASQHTQTRPLFASPLARGSAAVASAFAVLAILWLGWPARPAYEDALRNRGYPATLSEADEWYVAVPEDENRALEYIEITELQRRKEFEFRKALDERIPKGEARLVDWMYVDVLIVGRAAVELGEPLPESVRAATEEYWEYVTSHVAPALKELSADGPGGSRYPIDLNEGFAVALPYLAGLRGLARELGVDALHWSLAANPARAVDSVTAIVPLANSLAEEPLFISQLVRIAILGIASGSLEEVMNRTTLEEEDFVRLQIAFAEAMPLRQEKFILDRAMVGESLLVLDAIGRVSVMGTSERRIASLSTLFGQLVYPPAAERIVMTLYHEDMRHASRLSWPELAQWTDQYERFEGMFFMAPRFMALAPAVGRSYESEWRIRTQFDLAVSALAVERYRLAQGRLPERLDELVPVYLAAVSDDYFSPTGRPIRYRPEGGGNFVVYSVGRDMEDDGGVRMKRSWNVGDITFSIVSRGAEELQ